jgi:predicted amidohydrolase YtcJ
MRILKALFLLITVGSCTNNRHEADLIVQHAIIWTSDSNNPEAEAMAISGDTILAVGKLDEVMQWKGDKTQILDANRKFITPGFIDAHVHFLTGGMRLAEVQLRYAKTRQAFVDSIRKFAGSLPPGAWITGGDWDHENWGGKLPESSWIDSVTGDKPVFIIRLDGHMGLANSAALRQAGIDAKTPDVSGGTIVRDANGKPTGIFKDNAMDLIFKAIPEPGNDMLDRAIQAAMHYVASHGVTTVHSVGDFGFEKDISTFERSAQKGSSITRAYVAMPLAGWRQLASRVKEKGHGDKWVQTGLLKGFVDGSLGSHTAAFHKPFTDAPSDSGFFVNSEDSMLAWIKGADAAGLQCAIHAIGDRANHTILNIFDTVQQANGARDRRFRIEHAQHLAPADIPRFTVLGVIPSMQPYHAIDDGRWAEKVIGPERSKTTYAFRSLLAAKAPLAFGSDWFVAPPTPLEGIYAAVTRRTLDERNPGGWVPEEKITVEEALRAYTAWAAFAGFQEKDRGILKAGMLADFVILSDDLRKIDPVEIRSVKVEKTFVGGNEVFKR